MRWRKLFDREIDEGYGGKNRMKRGSKTAAWLLAGMLLAGSGNMNISIAAQSGEPLRCISFYSSVNGVSSTIFYVTESLQKNLEGDKEISLSVYSLSTDLYESLEYKVKTAAALDMDVMILSDLPEDLDPDILELLQKNHIFVIVVDGQPSSYENSAWIGTDNREMGVRAAQLGAERVAEYQAGNASGSGRFSAKAGGEKRVKSGTRRDCAQSVAGSGRTEAAIRAGAQCLRIYQGTLWRKDYTGKYLRAFFHQSQLLFRIV